ncbi:MAG: hypothetical protein IPL52_15880 [Flavobacteriales bacterium]|nr:hypothetical protein [Flavobacteriales bacterium]
MSDQGKPTGTGLEAFLSTLDASIRSGDPEMESLKQEMDWFIAIRSNNSERALLDKGQFVASLREGILSGRYSKTSNLDVHTKANDGKWAVATVNLGEFAKGRFGLRVLYEPIWAHAVSGLKWGAIVGVGLKLLDTLILLGSADPRMAALFAASVGVCFIPRFGFAACIGLAIVTAKVSKANFFIMGLSAALIGAVLGCLPGMAIGGAIGLARKKGLILANDSGAEGSSIILKAVVFPLLAGVTLWILYVFVFNPWLVSVLEE